MMEKKWWYVFLLLLLIGCTDRKAENSIRRVPVKTITVEKKFEMSEKTYVGTVEESSSVSLSFAVAGTIQQVLTDAGEKVSEGQTLAVLDKASLQNTYDIANSSLKQAKDAYERLTSLHQKGSLPEIKYIETQTQLAQAEAMEQIARKNLEDCVLRTPFSGYISECSAKAGLNVIPGLQVMRLVKTESVYIKIPVPEKEIMDMKVGQLFSFTVNALGEKYFKGRVTSKGVIANPLSHTYEVKLSVSNATQELMPGMVCQVYFSDLGKRNFDLIVVPQSAVLLNHDGSTFVWLDEKGVAEKRIIKVGDFTSKGNVIILQGLEIGEKVIVEGQHKVGQGTKIVVL